MQSNTIFKLWSSGEDEVWTITLLSYSIGKIYVLGYIQMVIFNVRKVFRFKAITTR